MRLRQAFLIILPVLLLACSVNSVELLVNAQTFWQRSEEIPTGTTQDTTDYLSDMWHQTHRGEVIVIKPNGWAWGGKERPPEYIVVKITGLSVAQAAEYIQGLLDSTLYDSTISPQPDTVDVKERKSYFLESFVDSALTLWSTDSSFVTMNKNKAKTVVKKHALEVIKQKIRDRLIY